MLARCCLVLFCIAQLTAATFVAVGIGTNSIASSLDGLTWTGQGTDVFPGGSPSGGNSVAYSTSQGRWVAVGQSSNNTIASSTDGRIWTAQGASVFTDGYGVVFSESQRLWVALGSRSGSIAHSADGLSWTSVSPPPLSSAGVFAAFSEIKSRWVAVGSGDNTIATSPDGKIWTGLGRSIFNVGIGVAYSAFQDQWIAVGVGSNSIASSPDGMTWTGQGRDVFSIARGVAFSAVQNRWVALGSGTNSIASSTDGITWTGHGTSIFTTGHFVIYSESENLWIALGEGPNTIATSVNGMTWTGQGATVFSSVGLGIAYAPDAITLTLSSEVPETRSTTPTLTTAMTTTATTPPAIASTATSITTSTATGIVTTSGETFSDGVTSGITTPETTTPTPTSSAVGAPDCDPAPCGTRSTCGLSSGGLSICQCGYGWVGSDAVGFKSIDPADCSIADLDRRRAACTYPSLESNSTAFIPEPVIDAGAEAGDFFVSVTVSPLAGSQPLAVSFRNPTDATECGLLPQLLGQGVWSQELLVPSCDARYELRSPFAAVISNHSECWSVETEAGVSIDSLLAGQVSVSRRTYSTLMETVHRVDGAQLIDGPLLRDGRSTTTLTQRFQRQVTISVPTSIAIASDAFLIQGFIQYRLREMLYDVVSNQITLVVETRVPDGVTLADFPTTSIYPTGSPISIVSTVPGACLSAADVGFEVGKCTQLFEVLVASTECSVADHGFVLPVSIACTPAAPLPSCGSNVTLGTPTATLPRPLPIDFDFCPIVQVLDVLPTLTLYPSDADRLAASNALAAGSQAAFGAILKARFGVSSSVGTISSINVTRVGIYLSDVSAVFDLPVPSAPIVGALPTYDFDVPVQLPLRAGFSYWAILEATVQFQDSGQLVRVSTLTRARSDPSESLASQSIAFGVLPRLQDAAVSDTPVTVAIVAGVVAGVLVVAAAVLFLIFLARRRRKKRREDESSQMATSVELGDMPLPLSPEGTGSSLRGEPSEVAAFIRGRRHENTQ